MKAYPSELEKNFNWVKKRNYIEASDSCPSLETMELVNCELINKFSIDKIKYDADSYFNKPDFQQIEYMKLYFYPFGWHPITINKNHELLDGQHRLLFAKKAGLKFIDVFLDRN